MLRMDNLPTLPNNFMLWDKDLCRYADVKDAENFCTFEEDDANKNTELTMHSYGRFKRLAYTGMKDRFGKRIYEGHIVKAHYEIGNNDYNFIGAIGFENTAFVIVESGFTTAQLSAFSSKEIEIIGNIFENADLLREEACDK